VVGVDTQLQKAATHKSADRAVRDADKNQVEDKQVINCPIVAKHTEVNLNYIVMIMILNTITYCSSPLILNRYLYNR